VLDIAPEDVLVKERLHPGKIFLVDTAQGRIIDDEEIKTQLAAQHPYRDWLRDNVVRMDDLPAHPAPPADRDSVLTRQVAFGYTHEDLRLLLGPMAKNGEEPLGSMGTDTSLAVLSNRPRPLYDYFKQLFAQVTNPPLDQIREELVTSMESTVGPEGNLLQAAPASCRQIVIKDPVLSNEEVAKLRHVAHPWFKSVTLPMLYPVATGAAGLERALEALQRAASAAIAGGANIVILSDRGLTREQAAIRACWPRPPCTITSCGAVSARAAGSSSRRAMPAKCTTCAC
jgi:glutamate synthase (ferredoxin)